MISTKAIERERKKCADQTAQKERERRKNAKSKVTKFLAYNNYRAALKQACRDEILDEVPKRILREHVGLFISSKDLSDLKIAHSIFERLKDTARVQLLDLKIKEVVDHENNRERADSISR
jgi:hypothetical protein